MRKEEIIPINDKNREDKIERAFIDSTPFLIERIVVDMRERKEVMNY